ncbi:uncharacterized protein MYCFIDRAFT_88292 [Pseudocercospora fijiensis CIRAD86]|uniref:Cyclin-like domain-containing protein n=1 Tax=Pseudocercospora fijiensis (strain CIRAD86) TaxID=383855 RepID=M3ANK5_PSEFD|nr:uncharacterized protein MYCFIDRAFT_88292 [Pseudocercospora fijiensis CIRAD86]EME86176.1 hypothetical protein MYCFIDRAFT_88292 [Pseudocercospora fijiensis CIRAD86]
MTDPVPSLHMYANSAIRFRDPFVSSKDQPPPASLQTYQHARSNWTSHASRPDFNRALTPPPEMNSTQKPSYHVKDYGQHYPEYAAQAAYKAPAPSYLPQEAHSSGHGRNHVLARASSNGHTSPVRQAAVEASHDITLQTRPSQQNTIAVNFQIPRTVNNSGGSLSELAAQITCLFWFESSEILQQIEDSPILLQPSRPLSPDAKPTTGFRKWVTTILSTTMVAQNVVLLALLFIYRLKKLNPTVRGKPGSEYRLLTVALMLGNKFLDDNTYTNKTWAEVSGINVAEVHIMEVEFLSNMKYCLFTSEQDWAEWQSLLGRFAQFFEKASRPQPLAPILPPASSLNLPVALPSPPGSNQASPPFPPELVHSGAYNNAGAHGPTPVPSPLARPEFQNGHQGSSRKRSLVDDCATEPPAKRMAPNYPSYTSPNRYSTMPPQPIHGQPVPKLTLPSLSIPPSQATVNAYSLPASQNAQLPPMTVPQRAMAMVYPNSSSQSSTTQVPASAGPSSQPQVQPHSQYSSRNQSPFGGSGTTSPTNMVPQSATALHPAAQISPSYLLQQRNSPYRPVHHVSTLLYPQPQAATQARPANIDLHQMQYQPLGKPTQHSGRLPYLGQNLWLDGNHPQEMTPVHQWPNFPQQQQPQQQQALVPQQ